MAIYPDKKGEKLTGRWRVELQSQGRRYRQRHDTHAEAKADEKRVKDLWAAGQEVEGNVAVRKDPHAPTLAYVIRQARPSLWRGKASEDVSWAHIDWIAAFLGEDLMLDDIRTQHADRIVAQLLKGSETKKPVSEATVNRYLSHFHTLLDWAKGRGFRKLPVADIVMDWQEESEGRIRWITVDEERQLERLLPPLIWKVVKLGIETGCRRGELLTVEPEQINGLKLHLWKTKTKTPRTVNMEERFVAMLLEVLAEGMPSESELRYQWDLAKNAMGLAQDDDFVFHCTRHTCATRLVEAGVNLRIIQRWLGHKRIETTMRYSHVHDEMLIDALEQRRAHQDRIRTHTGWGKGSSKPVGLQAA